MGAERVTLMKSMLLHRPLLAITTVTLVATLAGTGGNAAPPAEAGTRRDATAPRPTVVFTRDNDIWTATPLQSGSAELGMGTEYQLQQITHHARRAIRSGSPSWSPDGERIVFSSTRHDEKGDITAATSRGCDASPQRSIYGS